MPKLRLTLLAMLGNGHFQVSDVSSTHWHGHVLNASVDTGSCSYCFTTRSSWRTSSTTIPVGPGSPYPTNSIFSIKIIVIYLFLKSTSHLRSLDSLVSRTSVSLKFSLSLELLPSASKASPASSSTKACIVWRRSSRCINAHQLLRLIIRVVDVCRKWCQDLCVGMC